MILCIVSLILSYIFSTDAVPRPTYILPCSRSHKFDECALRHAKYAIPFLLNGDRQLKIPIMNPLKIPLVDLRGSNQFHLTIKNMEIYGLDKVNLLEVKTDFDKRTLHVKSTVDNITILGDYDMDGRILVPLTGHGRLNNSLLNGVYQYDVNWVSEARNGKHYAKIRNSSYDYTLENMTFDFTNLFNGDELLGKQMNKFLNENWEIVNEDLKKAVVDTLLAIHNDVADKIFSIIPEEELFLD